MYIHKPILFEWDESKNAYNKSEHGFGFELAYEFDWDSAGFTDRSRSIDGETRYAAVGYCREKLYTIIYTNRGDTIRIISMRRSNRKEERAYEQEKAETAEGL
jgi:uncharacterized protein